MFAAILITVAALVILGSLDSTPATRRPARSSGSIFDSPAKRRRICEREFVERFANERFDEAEAEVIRLRELVREALDDPNPWERLWPLHLELQQALSDYEFCNQRLCEASALL